MNFSFYHNKSLAVSGRRAFAFTQTLYMQRSNLCAVIEEPSTVLRNNYSIIKEPAESGRVVSAYWQQVYRTAVPVYSTPVLLYRTAVHLYRTTVEVYSATVHFYSEAVQHYSYAVHPYSIAVRPYSNAVKQYSEAVMSFNHQLNKKKLSFITRFWAKTPKKTTIVLYENRN